MEQTLLVTGGAGYVGSVLVPKLLAQGHRVRVLDALFFGEDGLAPVRGDPSLELLPGDLRDGPLVERALSGVGTVIHLASISNDPSAELDPEFTRTINYDAVLQLVAAARASGVGRFINASSGSVYGVKEEAEVVEELAMEPITLYGELKARSEEAIRQANGPGFTTVSIRSATVCGYSRRMRLDLTVNLLTSLAVNHGRITVFGGEQQRPNIHIDDITDLYARLVELPAPLIAGDVFNATGDNYTVMRIAEIVRDVVGPQIELVRVPTVDHRSYRLSGAKIARALGFVPRRGIQEAIVGVRDAFADGRLSGHEAAEYHNVATMRARGYGEPARVEAGR